jgi:hypothetical protein
MVEGLNAIFRGPASVVTTNDAFETEAIHAVDSDAARGGLCRRDGRCCQHESQNCLSSHEASL